MYWPSQKEASRDYGVLKVTFLGEEVFAHYTVRTFEVKPLDGCTHYTQVRVERISRRFVICAQFCSQSLPPFPPARFSQGELFPAFPRYLYFCYLIVALMVTICFCYQ